ncbi:MAG: thiol:disulfide interchange protein DsbA/DsbL [Casimicrobiaceae bacterium]|nr:thiol:disulfide interchange protein DsbA/DsbL [Casimicrobiaceae bacterium]MDW8311905.1 thiol:disulfide interchange protein DsbA/DsbL [Burkholderiales bacterium]
MSELSRRDWLRLSLSVLVTASPLAAVHALQQFVEGKHYTLLSPPQPTDSGTRIEVLEFFSYACPHCRDLEVHLEPWKAKLPADVAFRRVPVAFQPAWVNLGKIYYVLEALDRDDLTTKVFQAIHGANLRLHEEKVFFEWAANNGLDGKKVQELWASFGLNSKMNRARTLAANYKVDSVPMIFVEGRYRVQSHLLPNSHKDVPVLLDFLIARVRSERRR